MVGSEVQPPVIFRELKSQNFELKELRLHSDGEVFPVHTVNAETIAAYQAEFYTIPGIELPVMVLTEFYPHFSDPDALDTFPVPIAYVIRDGAVTWNLTPDESATIYDEREESQMIFINGELIKKFLLSGTSSREVEMRIDGLYEWLNAQ